MNKLVVGAVVILIVLVALTLFLRNLLQKNNASQSTTISPVPEQPLELNTSRSQRPLNNSGLSTQTAAELQKTSQARSLRTDLTKYTNSLSSQQKDSLQNFLKKLPYFFLRQFCHNKV